MFCQFSGLGFDTFVPSAKTSSSECGPVRIKIAVPGPANSSNSSSLRYRKPMLLVAISGTVAKDEIVLLPVKFAVATKAPAGSGWVTTNW